MNENDTLKVVIADDLAGPGKTLMEYLTNRSDSRFASDHITIIERPGDVIPHLTGKGADLVFLDLSFGQPRAEASVGLRLIREIRGNPGIRHIPVIAVTVADMEDEQERLLACGIDGFISKKQDRNVERWPFVFDIINRSLSAGLLRKEYWQKEGVLKKKGRGKYDDVTLYGTSEAMIRAFCTLFRIVSAAELPAILIRGMPGTGKTSFGRAIHLLSDRCDKDIVEVIVAHIPSTLLPSELFGIEAKTATGVQGSDGLLLRANHGTLLLDEIADLDAQNQVVLLKVLRDRTIRPVGTSKDIPLSFKLVCATNRNLEEMVERGEFREDLYHRIRGVQLHIPSLQERLNTVVDPEGANQELHLLLNLELKRLAVSTGRIALDPFHAYETRLKEKDQSVDSLSQIDQVKLPRPFEFTDDAWQLLLAHSWPGNYAELRTLVQELAVLNCTRVNLEMVKNRLMKSRSAEVVSGRE